MNSKGVSQLLKGNWSNIKIITDSTTQFLKVFLVIKKKVTGKKPWDVEGHDFDFWHGNFQLEVQFI